MPSGACTMPSEPPPKTPVRETPLLVSVHIPKTAGASLTRSLADAYPGRFASVTNRLMSNPADAPATPAMQKAMRSADCMHGHFHPQQVVGLSDRPMQFVVWVRNPVDRLISNYYYFQRHNVGLRSRWARMRGHWGALREQAYSEKWTLERFCLGPELRNRYTWLFSSFPVERFAFVGVTEHFSEDLQAMGRVIGKQLKEHCVNVRPRARQSSGPEDDPAFRRRVQEFHQLDMALYESILERRNERLREL